MEEAAWMKTVTVDLISFRASCDNPSSGFSMSPSKTSILLSRHRVSNLSAGRWVRENSTNRLFVVRQSRCPTRAWIYAYLLPPLTSNSSRRHGTLHRSFATKAKPRKPVPPVRNMVWSWKYCWLGSCVCTMRSLILAIFTTPQVQD